MALPAETPWNYNPPRCYEEIPDGLASLEQGDLLFDFPMLLPIATNDPNQQVAGGSHRVELLVTDVVVLTQSCDLQASKVETVILGAVGDLAELAKIRPEFFTDKMNEEIRRGNQPSFHLLHASNLDTRRFGVALVNFRQIYTVPFAYVQGEALKSHARIRTLSPYREHLAQAFGRFVMRVGLPAGIPKFR